MKLAYNVLWFEDNQNSVSEFCRAIGKRLEKEGFDFRVVWGPCDASKMKEMVSSLQRYNPFDLVLFDFDLGDGLHGEDLAAALRKKIWTEIFYYSAKRTFEALSKGMSKHKVDGVFFAVRKNLEDRLWSIIEAQIKRSCDLNNMRGIVLDAMSEIDVGMRTFLETRFAMFSSEQKAVTVSKVGDVFAERRKDLEKVSDRLSEKTFPKLLTDYVHVDFQMIRNRLADIDDCFKDGDTLAKLQANRNIMAHQVSEFDEKKNTIDLVNPKTGHRTSFTYDDFRNIRKDLLVVRKKLIQLGVPGL